MISPGRKQTWDVWGVSRFWTQLQLKKKKQNHLLLPEVQGNHPALAVHLFPQGLHYLLGLVDQGSQVSPAKEHSSLDQQRTDGTPTIGP